MKSVITSLFAVLSIAAPHFVFAFDWSSASGGAIEIAEPVTVSTDEDAAKMAALSSITIAEGGSILCEGLSSPITLACAFSGPGKFSAVNCAAVTLQGDNSNFIGGFAFTNTSLLVASRYGLGGANTQALSFDYGASNASFDFDYADDVMTNDVPILIRVVERANNAVFGPSSTSKTLVLLGGLQMEEGGYGTHNMNFRGKIVFDGGTFGVKTKYLYSYQSGAAELWFNEKTSINIAGGYWFALYGKYHFNCAYEKLQYYAPNSGVDTVCEKENAFPENIQISMYNTQTKDTSSFDLNGFDQKVGLLKNQQSDAAGKYALMTSAKEATLTLSSTAMNTQEASYKITGKVSIHQTGKFTQKFIGHVSTSTGGITVSDGAIEFASNAGWSGEDILVEGGVLILNSPNALASAKHRLVVRDTGKLKLTSAVQGTGAYFAEATFGSVSLPLDTVYTVAQLKAMDGVKDFIDESSDDDAQIRIAPELIEWTGWPQDGGAVTVPVGATVEISDDDVENVACITYLKLMPSSVVRCVNKNVPLVLSAEVAGEGIIDIQSPAGVTLAGDSSALDAPGCYIARDSVVTVTHRYGLGDAGTASCQSLGGDLIFKGNGLTNDVAIYYTGDNGRLFGPRDCRGPWVQNGDFLTDKAVSGDYTHFTNDVVFGGSCRYGAMGGGVLFYNLASNANFYAGPGTVMYYPQGSKGISFYMLNDRAGTTSYNISGKVSEDTGFTYVRPQFSAARYVMGAEDIFANLSEGLSAYGAKNPLGCFDLAGYDQTVTVIRVQETFSNPDAVTTQKMYLPIHSEKPATLTITKPMEGEFSVGMQFTGAVNFTYAGRDNDPYKLWWQPSTSTGALTVESGALHLVNGNSWGGTNVFLKGGSLVVPAGTASPFAAVNERGKANADLVVSGDGSLELGEGVVAAVRCLQVDGEWMRRGEYTASAQCPWLKGAGKVCVRKDSPKPGISIIFR